MGWGARFAGVLVAGVVLSACGGAGPEGQALPAATTEATSGPTSSASSAAAAEPAPSATPSSPSEAPPLPDAAKEKSALGLQAFARYYIDVYNYALRSGETALLASLGTDDCATCAAYVKQIKEAYGAGGRIEGGTVKIFSSSAPKLVDGVAAVVDAEIEVTREKDLDKSGGVVKKFAAQKRSVVFFYPKWRDGKWILDEVKLGVTE